MRRFDNARDVTKDGEKGIVLIVCVILLLMLSLIGIASITTSNSDMQVAGNEQFLTSAFYLAEAGAERAYDILQDSVNWRAGFTSQPFGNGTYDVVVLDSSSLGYLGQDLLLRSTGRAGGTTVGIEVKLTPRYDRRFRMGAYGEEDLTIRNLSFVDSYSSDSGSYAAQAINGPDSHGNMFASQNTTIGSNGDVDISLDSEVHGDAFSSSGQLAIDASSNVSGDTAAWADSASMPPVPASEMTWAQNNNDNSTGMTFTGNVSYDPVTYKTVVQGSGSSITLASGTYYFSSLEIKNGAVLQLEPGAQVTIYLADKFDVMNGSVANPSMVPVDLLIYSTGDYVRLKSDGAVFAGAVYAPNAVVTCHVGGDWYGAVVGRTVDITNGSKLHYDEALSRVTGSIMSGYEKVAWRER